MLAKQNSGDPSPLAEVDVEVPAIPAVEPRPTRERERIEIEDLTDIDVRGEYFAAMQALRWVAERRARGFLPD